MGLQVRPVRAAPVGELHACSDAGEIGENTQATMAELGFFGPRRWSVSTWLEEGIRVPLLALVDAKGLWTKIQSEYKTEKLGTIYVRKMMEVLYRIQARVYWVNSGHMVADALTKLSTKSPPPNMDLLLHVLETNSIRITSERGCSRMVFLSMCVLAWGLGSVLFFRRRRVDIFVVKVFWCRLTLKIELSR